MRKTINKIISLLGLLLITSAVTYAQQRNYKPYLMEINVGNFYMKFDKALGDGGLQSQFSYDIVSVPTPNNVLFKWPRDQYQSGMLFQIFNPISLDEKVGIKDIDGKKMTSFRGEGKQIVNSGQLDWAIETRRYRPPNVFIDGVNVTPPYRWNVDPTLKADIKVEFEDVLPQFGIRSHVEIYAFSNPRHADYMIWKATHKFTGEIARPSHLTAGIDSLPDQTIRLWWPFGMSFGPSKIGVYQTSGASWGYEGEDDLDNWARQPSVVPNGERDTLTYAYFWDSDNPGVTGDDTGDPDPETGHLYSPQIPGYALLYADKSASVKMDDRSQPYAMSHVGIQADFWGDTKLPRIQQKYRGDYLLGRFPKPQKLEKGPMRLIVTGPYELTKNTAESRYDSLTFVYAIGAGSIGEYAADSIGKATKSGGMTVAQRNAVMMQGKDSLFATLSRANWAYKRLSNNESIPTPPPPPDIDVKAGPYCNFVSWSYSDPSYFKNTITGVDDWDEWKVYRKRGASLTDDPLDQKSGAKWELVYSTKLRDSVNFIDRNVQRGVNYFYAVTAVNNGSQNNTEIFPGERLESSKYANMTQIPVIPFQPGLAESDKIRIVPNPATSYAAGAQLNAGEANRISFFNLPYKCTLKIFTETGDLIKTIDHIGTADDKWDQRTSGNQYVVSGLYILAVTNCKALDGKNLPDQFLKFVIVR
ncbi:MAG: hypothetical protein HF314_03210 [Ignavibacteria bacterium]|jgi:hypothetical protein|nr:hypothetical protein [Ignavibacteria bacterium]MCU7502059.1 hypothetical protein [Ignavibacteria bacterium]MCU7515461.1 hypothetical protein [Ignavibacteria bacterium]